ncbi:hypothetical protein [Leptothoe sp. PORK10 BA2]|uniref:hypothetical protein n=1 Tax=Leptothoe sp. PORK10 BA2 TaxID=3110254 RepID=UPI002B219FB2|nr:hypothetical protein [Leptothoe sp. PORK10 BA2]MEA5464941.1 hypothetical protein [Leptothoe sp. PORK10 BA2]
MDGWIVVLFIALTVVIIVISIVLDRKRTEAIKQLAYTLGFDYREHPQAHLPHTIWQFDLFNKGRRRRLKNLIQGIQNDARVSIGEYRYTTGSKKSKNTHSQTVVFIESDQLNLPSFLLTSENAFHKIGNLFGYKDIDFDSHPEFSSQYLLRGSDEDRVRELFHEGVLNVYRRYGGASTRPLA